MQVSIGFLTAFFYLVAIFYAINDLDTVLSSSSTFPLAEIYVQATNSAGGALGLLIVAFLPTFLTLVGCYLTAGRMFWTLARDNAVPFSHFFSRVSPTFENPFSGHSLNRCVHHHHGLHLRRLYNRLQRLHRLLYNPLDIVLPRGYLTAPARRQEEHPARLFLDEGLRRLRGEHGRLSLYDGVYRHLLLPLCAPC